MSCDAWPIPAGLTSIDWLYEGRLLAGGFHSPHVCQLIQAPNPVHPSLLSPIPFLSHSTPSLTFTIFLLHRQPHSHPYILSIPPSLLCIASSAGLLPFAWSIHSGVFRKSDLNRAFVDCAIEQEALPLSFANCIHLRPYGSIYLTSASFLCPSSLELSSVASQLF